MVQRLREILLTKYIGSMLIALFCWQILAALIEAVLRTLFWFINEQRSHSVLGSAHPPFPWDQLIYSAVTMVLYLLAAYALVGWLHPADPPPSAPAESEEEPAMDQP